MSGWRAGGATTTFDVPAGTRLGGYADREEPSTGTHDTLEISALCLAWEGRWLQVIAADVAAVDGDLVVEIAQAAGVRAEDVLLCATHTHSGPQGVAVRVHPASSPTVEPGLRARFLASAARVVIGARRQVRPVELAIGEVTVEGAWSNRTDPSAAGDNRVRFLAATGEDGSLGALLMLVPCHPTVLGAWNLEVSADLHGGIRRAVRRRLGARGVDTTLLTATGAAGDISTRFCRSESSFAEVDRLGDTVAAAVVSELDHVVPVGEGLDRGSETVWLPMREREPEAELREYEVALAAWTAVEHDSTVPEAEKRRVYTRLQGANILREMGDIPPVAASIGGWRLGATLALASVPGEPFSSCGRRIETDSRFRATWVLGYANGYVGYLVDDAAMDAGTYEALASPYGVGADRVVAGAALSVLRDLG